MEIPRLEVKSELQLPAYTTAKAMPGGSRIRDLKPAATHILNPLSKARDGTRILTEALSGSYLPSQNGNSLHSILDHISYKYSIMHSVNPLRIYIKTISIYFTMVYITGIIIFIYICIFLRKIL